jgi:Holliday junction resolvase-like predicted endonuclease
MVFEFEELVLAFDQAQLDTWKAGNKALMPAFVERRQIVERQPSYHFGEAFVLEHFHRTEGWVGYADYMLMPEVEPGIARHYKGRAALEAIAPVLALQQLRTARRRSLDGRKGYGEPDLFLHHPSGRIMFLEVKKGSDRLKENQLVCLAQIRQFLGCRAEVVFLREQAQRERRWRSWRVELAPDGSPISVQNVGASPAALP